LEKSLPAQQQKTLFSATLKGFKSMNLQTPFSALSYFALFAATDGKHYIWGSNIHTALGLGDSQPTHHSKPQLLDIPPLAAVACGYAHCVALTEDQQLFVWGANDGGQLGLGTNRNESLPKVLPFPSEERVVKIACSSRSSFALTESGALYAWGGNSDGELGLREDFSVLTPTRVAPPSTSPIVDIACGHYHTLLITEDGSLYACGVNGSGELGLGFEGKSDCGFQKVNLSNVSQISCGSCHSMAITEDGSLYTWGWNGHGTLGFADQDDRSKPSLLLCDVLAVANGGSHCLALKKDGSLWSWGNNDYWQTGQAHGRYTLTPTPVILHTPEISDNSEKSVAYRTPKVSGFGCGWSYSYFFDEEGTMFLFGSVSNQFTEKQGISALTEFLVMPPLPDTFRFLSGKWNHVFSWLFLGRRDKTSGFFVFPDEVIFHFTGLHRHIQ
jgi:alpha-tubulin suppressor-like RCC1 family protein